MSIPAQPSIIAGKYRLLHKLGQGAMGTVWQAEHLTLKSQVAIKFIQVDTASHADALLRFSREAQAAASLRSPHVVQILDYGVDDGVPYIAMELLEGETLADRLTRVGRLEPSEVSHLMMHVGRAVARAHEAGIVHRDLKPDNVFVVRNDDEELAKVLDFGIAKSSAMEGLGAPAAVGTRTGAVMGTPYYMSPEQTEGAKDVDLRSDIWSLGVIAFECILGKRPFEAETLGGLLLGICTRPMPIPSQLGKVPAGFDAWFARACARDLSQRFASAREATQELRRVCDESAPGMNTNSAWPAPPAPTTALAPEVKPALGDSRGVPGQAVEGFASTHLDRAGASPKRTKRLSVFAFFGALLLGAIVLGWFLLARRAVPVSSAAGVLASGAPASARSGAFPGPPPLPIASDSPRATSASTAPSASVEPPAITSPPPLKHGEHRARVAPSAAASPANASSVNLGI